MMVNRFVAIIDVGHGNCCVIRDQGTAVIDTGLGTGLLEFLRENHIKHVDVILLSHADQDHISGLVHLIASRAVSIGRVRLNTDTAKRTKLWQNLLYELESENMQNRLNVGVALTAESAEDFSQGKVSIEVLAPGTAMAGTGPGGKLRGGETITTNSISCVLRLCVDGKPLAIIPGDIDDVGVVDLVRRIKILKKDIDAPLLIYPHHGGLSGSSNEEQFAKDVCALFKPKVVVFSIGRGKHGTPQPEIVDAVRRQDASVRIACTQLSERCASQVPPQNPKHLLPYFADGRSERSCCAGTMLMDLDALGELLPAKKDHEEFVTSSADKALCRRKV